MQEGIGRFPRGKRGLKYVTGDTVFDKNGRFPRGKRGLKFVEYIVPSDYNVASPAGSVD